MPDSDTVRAWEGRTMVDRDGTPVGSIRAIYLDDRTGKPEWALVNTGLFGTRVSFVPLSQAAETGGNVQVPYDKRLIRDAPNVDVDQHLSEGEERQLWRHYGLDDDAIDRRARDDVEARQVQQAVPVRQERVRLEPEPIEVDDQDTEVGRHERRRRR
jgi:PRC-barrel domain